MTNPNVSPIPTPTGNLLWPVVAGQLRHVISGAGASLVLNGVITRDQEGAFENIAMGAIVYGLGAGWSWWQKVGQAQVAAQLAKLRHHVDAIPPVPSNLPQASAINAKIESAQIAAVVPAAT